MSEEFIFFDSKGLDLLVKQMGFDDAITFDEKPRQMLIDIGNEFMGKLLEESMRVSQKRQSTEEEKKQTKKLAIQDVKFALCIMKSYVEHCLRVPQQNFQIEKDN